MRSPSGETAGLSSGPSREVRVRISPSATATWWISLSAGSFRESSRRFAENTMCAPSGVQERRLR